MVIHIPYFQRESTFQRAFYLINSFSENYLEQKANPLKAN